jgi:hypothetical protein
LFPETGEVTTPRLQLNNEKREIADLAKEMNSNVEKLNQFYQDNKEVLEKNGLTSAARDLVQ